ncbi:BON domain-containing protein [Paraburkholderia sp. MMS20-SJTR3]|uniref:BON domain-containing protein n=1 Tax=Paraburkholderia sejongensis TaxID=2886946 RepID=A0ABS8K0R0_9BURK|nr:BON domain-containing protein [Paraburkholderia sp. MMS20-SJTR3]MCC8395673.1 BON domain-containing protein [Paraburkholderia sp. MMS20-SJTR3]
MNVHKLIKLAGATALVLGCLNAHAQPQTTGSARAAEPPVSASQSTAEIRTANRQLARDVRRAFRAAKNQGLRASNVTVRASNGVVTLTGSVPTAEQVELAASVAKGVSGVQSVINRVAVRKEFSSRGSN